jgi:hypothetical protein
MGLDLQLRLIEGYVSRHPAQLGHVTAQRFGDAQMPATEWRCARSPGWNDNIALAICRGTLGRCRFLKDPQPWKGGIGHETLGHHTILNP